MAQNFENESSVLCLPHVYYIHKQNNSTVMAKRYLVQLILILRVLFYIQIIKVVSFLFK